MRMSKHEALTMCIYHKGLSGYSSVVCDLKMSNKTKKATIKKKAGKGKAENLIK